MATPNLNLLREKFSELTRAEPHLGLNPRAPSLEGGASINDMFLVMFLAVLSNVHFSIVFCSVVRKPFGTKNQRYR